MLKTDSPIFLQNMNMIACQLFLLFKKSTTFWDNPRICSLSSNIFFSETALPINAKFHVEPPWEGVTKVYINGPGHMTKMANMPIYGKNL